MNFWDWLDKHTHDLLELVTFIIIVGFVVFCIIRC